MSWAVEHIGLIRKTAHRVYRRAVNAGAALEFEDLVQDGCEIAIKAESRYEVEQGRVSTYLQLCLMRSFNRRIDQLIQTAHFEQCDEGLMEIGGLDNLSSWDFCRQLSDEAQALLVGWVSPSPALQVHISNRTIGRRSSFKAYLLYLKEQGLDGERLKSIETEIMRQVEDYA